MTTRDDYGSDPAGGELADVARRGAREWERDMAGWEAEAEMLRLRQRSLANVLWEAMQRGDLVTVSTGGLIFSGKLIAARRNLAIMHASEQHIALNVGALRSVSIEPGSDGVIGERMYGSFEAYIGMLEVEGLRARFVGVGFDIRGTVAVVASDHVLVDAEGGPGRWALALPSLAAVLTGA